MALTKTGDYFVLTPNKSRHELRELRNKMNFYCPQCKETVMLKVGDIMIPHFAHYQDSNCRTNFSEGESAAHLQGKQQLYEFFQQFEQVEVLIEPYFKTFAQRPDLLVKTSTDVIPIEFQCSKLSLAKMSLRTEGYQQVGMKPIWILQTPPQLQQLPQGISIYSLSHFEQKFLTHSHPEGSVFLTYHPQTKKFHYFSSLFHVYGRQFIGNHRVLPIEKQSFPFARPKIPTNSDIQKYYSLFSSLRSRFLHSRIFYNRKGIKDPFLRQCYELKLIPSELPLWIGVPISFQNVCSLHPCEWQLALIYFMKINGISFRRMTYKQINEFLRHYNIYEEEAVVACEKYVSLLQDLGIESIHDSLNLKELHRLETLLPQYLQSEMKIEKI